MSVIQTSKTERVISRKYYDGVSSHLPNITGTVQLLELSVHPPDAMMNTVGKPNIKPSNTSINKVYQNRHIETHVFTVSLSPQALN